MTIFRILIPFTTFLLGVFFTLFLKRREHSREVICRNVTEICDLVNDWFNQLHEIVIELQFSNNISELERRVHFYGQNRLVLPRVIRTLEVLKGYKSCNGIVREAENFLRLVTNYDPNVTGKTLACQEFLIREVPGQTRRHVEQNFSLFVLGKKEKQSLESLMSKLDSGIQKINKEAAELLK